jgi:hypothetical protein
MGSGERRPLEPWVQAALVCALCDFVRQVLGAPDPGRW